MKLRDQLIKGLKPVKAGITVTVVQSFGSCCTRQVSAFHYLLVKMFDCGKDGAKRTLEGVWSIGKIWGWNLYC